jgi:hypothetical protein
MQVCLHHNIFLAALYTKLLAGSNPEVDRNIEKDIARTFPDIKEFKEPGHTGKNKLFNILKAYGQYDTKVGYCQGMDFGDVFRPQLYRSDVVVAYTERTASFLRLDPHHVQS